jgi:uncharacterized protein YyaL (SSP411 family)
MSDPEETDAGDDADGPDDPLSRNRLGDEQSPYLRQHADNPVDWQPWDDAALAAARERDRPIFLSVGYSACHWCHVMAEESFEDETVAAVLDESFVPVKVDREERPDLDSLYQTICGMVTGNGGWPLSVFLTPDGRPFYVGTYFPPEPRHGRPSFLQLCEDIAESWNDPDQREDIEERADQWTRAIEDELEDVPQPDEAPDEAFVDSVASAALRSADREHGGFGTGQKFPNTGRIHALLRGYERSRRAGDPVEEYRRVVVETLSAMADRGLYDHVGGGFHRYATDREWSVPHFEKMLYDQAEIGRAMLAGYRLTGRERYRETVAGTVDFLERELQHPEGGYFSTLDAQSGGEEGAFYVWTPGRIHAAVDDTTDAELFCERYGVTDAGNFEGANVLAVSASVADLADDYGLPAEEVRERLERARGAVFEARSERERPARDEKILAGWNGLMIHTMAEAGLILGEGPSASAREALSFVRERLWDEEERRLTRRWKDGDAAIDGYLEDYAFLGQGALALYGVTGGVDHLAFALDLGRATVERFYDDDRGTLYFTPAGGEDLVARPQEVQDRSTPSSLGAAVSLLLALDSFSPDDRFGDVAGRVVETQARRVEASPLEHVTLALAADEYAAGHVELTAATPDAALPGEWRERLGGTYLPRRLLAPRPADDGDLAARLDALGLDEAPPIWAGRDASEEPTVYLCEGFTCSPPQSSLEAALAWREGESGK